MLYHFRSNKFQINIETVASLFLLIVLSSLVIILIALTGQSYKNISLSAEKSSNERTAYSFISTKIRQSDTSGNIKVVMAPWNDTALVISNIYDSKTYENWIFYYDGALREVLIPKETKIDPSACEPICDVEKLELSQLGKKVQISLDNNERSSSLDIVLRS